MNRLVRTSMFYMIFGLVSGLFYREFTKFNNFTGKTQLSVLHTHTLILGMFFFLFVLLLEKNFKISQQKNYRKFYLFYNIGLGITILMMLIRGSLTVLDYGALPALAGIAGVGHIIITIGLFFFFFTLLGSVSSDSK